MILYNAVSAVESWEIEFWVSMGCQMISNDDTITSDHSSSGMSPCHLSLTRIILKSHQLDKVNSKGGFTCRFSHLSLNYFDWLPKFLNPNWLWIWHCCWGSQCNDGYAVMTGLDSHYLVYTSCVQCTICTLCTLDMVKT